MNNKRQTIWLVSMLSLMVVLSAYYLFTEDVSQLEVKTALDSPKELVITAGQLDGIHPAPAAADTKSTTAPAEGAKPDAKAEGAKAEGAKADPKAADPKAQVAEPQTQEKPDAKSDAKPEAEQAAPGTDAKTDTKADPNTSSIKTDKPSAQPAQVDAQPVSKSESSASADAQVLQQLESQKTSGQGYFVDLQLNRDAEWSKKVEGLTQILSDSKQTQQAAADAETELRKLQDMETKITLLEDSLSKQFPQAVVTQEAGKWKVTVQAKSLERSQASSITELAIKELGIAKESIAVQYKP